MPKPNLKSVLYANTAFSTVSGLAMLLFSGWISSQVLELPTVAYEVMGVGLLGFAAAVFYVAIKLPGSFKLAKLIFWADLGWVVATPVAMLLLADSLSVLGNWLLLGIAATVGALALFEWLAMRDSTQELAGA